jgi:tetratricopeptide (TPR) repeat protein
MSDSIAISLERIDALTAQGDLIGAWRLLNEGELGQSGHSGVLVARARLLGLRGRHDEARFSLEQRLLDSPCDRVAQVELARIAMQFGEPEVAHTWYERAYRDETWGEGWVLDWADLLCRLNRLEVAQSVVLAYCECVPARAHGWFVLGLTYQLQKQHDLALSAYERALQLDATVPMLRNNMAASYLETGAYGKAKLLLEQALREESTNPFAWTNLALVLQRGLDPAAAQVAAERACVLAPDYLIALQTCSNIHKELQEWDSALALIQRGLTLAPGDASMSWSLAMLQLLRGDYAAGWLSHEARWDGSPELRNALPQMSAPRWQGDSLAGKTLFVWSEQGYGDVIQFVRFLPLIAERVRRERGKLVFCCYSGLSTLVARSLGEDVDMIVAHDQSPLPPHDFHLPLASLPLILNVAVDQLPLAKAYLKTDAAKVDAWRARWPARSGRFRVGLVWSGSRTHQRNPLRAVDPLAYARTFKHFQSIDFVSVQLDGGSDVQAMGDEGLRVIDHSGELRSFDDTAALVQSMDLVITVCTSAAHLAGSLGVQTWVLLDVNPHWVWMTERSDSPWYPSIRLYRQQKYGQWAPVLEWVARDLEAVTGTVLDHCSTAQHGGESMHEREGHAAGSGDWPVHASQYREVSTSPIL